MNEIESFTPNDSRRLGQLEEIVSRGKKTFVEVGLALAEIREKRLYREQFKTFEDYCQRKWDFTRQYANQIIASAEVVKSLPKKMETIVSNPGQARALQKIPPPRRIEVLTAAKSAGPITAKTIAATASQLLPPPRKRDPIKPPTKDATGLNVPPEIRELWDFMSAESQRLLSIVSDLRSRLKRAMDTDELGFREITHNDVIAKLDLVYGELKLAKPYAVCAECQGVDTSHIHDGKQILCASCKGRGFVSKLFWESCVPSDIKKAAGRDK